MQVLTQEKIRELESRDPTNGYTPLMTACAIGDVDTVRSLMLYCRRNDLRAIPQIPVSDGTREVVGKIIPNQNDGWAVWMAKAALTAGGAGLVMASTWKSPTPTSLACENRHLKILELLVNKDPELLNIAYDYLCTRCPEFKPTSNSQDPYDLPTDADRLLQACSLSVQDKISLEQKTDYEMLIFVLLKMDVGKRKEIDKITKAELAYAGSHILQAHQPLPEFFIELCPDAAEECYRSVPNMRPEALVLAAQQAAEEEQRRVVEQQQAEADRLEAIERQAVADQKVAADRQEAIEQQAEAVAASIPQQPVAVQVPAGASIAEVSETEIRLLAEVKAIIEDRRQVEVTQLQAAEARAAEAAVMEAAEAELSLAKAELQEAMKQQQADLQRRMEEGQEAAAKQQAALAQEAADEQRAEAQRQELIAIHAASERRAAIERQAAADQLAERLAAAERRAAAYRQAIETRLEDAKKRVEAAVGITAETPPVHTETGLEWRKAPAAASPATRPLAPLAAVPATPAKRPFFAKKVKTPAPENDRDRAVRILEGFITRIEKKITTAKTAAAKQEKLDLLRKCITELKSQDVHISIEAIQNLTVKTNSGEMKTLRQVVNYDRRGRKDKQPKSGEQWDKEFNQGPGKF